MKKLLVLTTSLALFSFATAAEAVVKLEKVNNNGFNVALDSDKDVYGLQFDLVCDSKINESSVNHAFSSSDVRSNMSVYSRLRMMDQLELLCLTYRVKR